MLGTTLDYFILRGLAHSRNRATEEQLNRCSSQVSAESFEKEMSKFRKIIGRFEGHLPIDPGLRYLDMGCGTGELTIAFAKLGVRRITGVDVLPRRIERAQAYVRQLGMGRDVQFICGDLHAWVPEEKYDVLLSFDVLEHIEEPEAFLRKITGFAAPGGIAVLAFGPLFHSPYGDHMWDFFRLQIPWRGILFPEQAVLRVRRECFRPTDPAKGYREVAGGLNLMRYSEFLKYVRNTGWEFDYLAVNTCLRRLPPLRFISDIVTRVPAVRDYFVHNVYAVLRRAGR
ncbi:MAG: class I SAM-dependent methyltransferase [Betaproteobacteria bacterium]|nr:MAG: class I SAM-dependent methyltransferase [Betaproteobacteria bacterium]TMG77587.1 MAG: class I SAM-dependent methyltransferase [Betaproteobacteria bacterium]